MADPSRLTYGILRTVREVCETRSASRAAENLGVSQPAVSQSLQKFQSITGMPVFAGKGQISTDFQLNWMPLLSSVTSGMEEIMRRSKNRQKALPLLGVSDCLGSIMLQDISLFTKISQAYNLVFCAPGELRERFRRGELDLVVRPLFKGEKDQGLIGEISIAFWIPEEGWKAETRIRKQEELALVLRGTACPFLPYIYDALERVEMPYKTIASADSYWVAREMAGRIGAAFPAPAYLEEFVNSENRKFQTLVDFECMASWGVIYNEDKIKLVAAMSVFDEFASKVHGMSMIGRNGGLSASRTVSV